MTIPPPQRILVIQLRRIGDVLMTTPAIRALAQTFPQAQIDLLSEPPASQLFAHHPHLHQTITAPAQPSPLQLLRLIQQLRQQCYQVVIDCFGNPRSAILTLLSKAPTRIGFNFRQRQIAYTHRISLPQQHPYSALHKAALLQPFNIPLPQPQLEIALPPNHRQTTNQQLRSLKINPQQPLAVFSPVSRKGYKRWPPHRFAHLANYLAQTHQFQILIAYGNHELPYAQQMAQHTHTPYTLLLPQKLLDFAAILAHASLFIGNDNGPRHIAIALKTPTLAPFLNQQAQHWTPPHSPQHQTIETNNIQQLSTQAMLNTMKQWLQQVL